MLSVLQSKWSLPFSPPRPRRWISRFTLFGSVLLWTHLLSCHVVSISRPGTPTGISTPSIAALRRQGRSDTGPLKKILVANRGVRCLPSRLAGRCLQTSYLWYWCCSPSQEIAIRIFRTAHELGMSTVAIYSHEDRFGAHRNKVSSIGQLYTLPSCILTTCHARITRGHLGR